MDQKNKTLGKWSQNREGPFQISQVFSNNDYKVKELGPEDRTQRINGMQFKKYKLMLQEIWITEE